jgi:23S rRNA (cytidine1920-2'-O)/16S rRNA (cytidine1409-2'-O)-methyltransferase
MYDIECKIEVIENTHPYVSRGGIKLEHALNKFNIFLTNKVAVDIGASTGGFTDCLLQRGVGKIFAVDVGYGQLDWKLQSDSRVNILDRKNARNLNKAAIGELVDLAVIDVSFISLKFIIPAAINVLKLNGNLIALVKPQFEVGKDEVENKGIIKNPKKHLSVLVELNSFMKKQGWPITEIIPSPITGQKGNREFLIHCLAKGNSRLIEDDHIHNMIKT